jgi:hypothetical protein
MRTLRVGQALAAAGITAAAVLTPVVTATPAAAYDYAGPCWNYVGDHGYRVGPKVQAACEYGALQVPIWAANPNCMLALTQIGVALDVAQEACRRAHL